MLQLENDAAVEKNSGPAPSILKKNDGIVVAEVGTLCVAVWRKDSTRHRFDVQKAGLAEVIRKFPANSAFFCVVEPTSGAPNEDVRKASSLLFKSHARDLRAIAMVIEGNGFRSAIVRSVASGIVMLMGSRETPISYFATVESGAQWIKQYIDIGPVPRFVKDVEYVRRCLEPY